MIGNRKVLVVVPARGGSKGVPKKNIREVLGTPLVAMVADIVREVPEIDRCVVSTDSDEIAQVAEAAGMAAPFRRPEELSGDRIGDLEVLQHALLASEEHDGTQYDIVVMLQPTSPLRRSAQVAETIRKLDAGGYDAVWTVSPADLKYHPLKALKIDGEVLDLYDERGRGIIARQQLTPLYYRNGAAYAITRECLLDQKSILGTRTGAVVVDEPVVSIDTLEDFARVEEVLRARMQA